MILSILDRVATFGQKGNQKENGRSQATSETNVKGSTTFRLASRLAELDALPAKMDKRAMRIIKGLLRAPRFLTVGVIVIVPLSAYIIYEAPHNDKQLYVQCLTGLLTFSAVLYALFGDYLKSIFNGIVLTIEVPEENNSDVDLLQSDSKIIPAYWHHLVVINQTPHHTVVNCRVWLKKIYIRKDVLNNEPIWEDKKFAVPRLMNWAPSEWECDKRTFCTEQVFHLGWKGLGDDSLKLVVNSALQASSIQLDYPSGQTIKICLSITADNYQSDNEFYFVIEIPKIKQGEIMRPAIVTPSKAPK